MDDATNDRGENLDLDGGVRDGDSSAAGCRSCVILPVGGYYNYAFIVVSVRSKHDRCYASPAYRPARRHCAPSAGRQAASQPGTQVRWCTRRARARR